MINNRNIKDMTLKERFDSRGFGVNSYSKAYGVNHSILSQVLDGVYSGRNINENGSTRRIIAQLKKDKVWIGKLPWEV